MSSMLHTASGDGGAAKTRLMYSAYLSFAQVTEYLRFLVERGLIAYREKTRTYATTEKGIRFLTAADEVENLIGLETDEQSASE